MRSRLSFLSVMRRDIAAERGVKVDDRDSGDVLEVSRRLRGDGGLDSGGELLDDLWRLTRVLGLGRQAEQRGPQVGCGQDGGVHTLIKGDLREGSLDVDAGGRGDRGGGPADGEGERREGVGGGGGCSRGGGSSGPRRTVIIRRGCGGGRLGLGLSMSLGLRTELGPGLGLGMGLRLGPGLGLELGLATGITLRLGLNLRLGLGLDLRLG